MSEWQPIETAPKDGTYILIAPGLWTGVTCGIGVYDLDRYAKKPRAFWRRVEGHGRSQSREVPPTHWMPLPEPPK